MMNQLLRQALCAASLTAVAAAVQAQAIGYDPATQVLTIPSVSVGGATYTNVTLRNTGNYVFALQGATEQVPAAPAVATYDLATNVLRLPSVQVGSATFLDVTLQNTGNYVFTLQGAAALEPQVLADAQALLAAQDALWATAVPASGAARLSLTDDCYLSDGRAKARLVADADAEPALYAARDAHLVGRTTTNVKVLAVRQTTNADGSARREIDVLYDTQYRDGTVGRGLISTLISGSSSGTPGCAVGQDSAALRLLGNQRLVGFSVSARNARDERYSLATGAALAPAVNYRREVRWAIADPAGKATYAIVTGPGPAGTVDGGPVPFSLKFLAPRVLRSAPELAGKNGNFLNWRDDDGFRYCRISGSNVPVATLADCTGQGVASDNWGWTTGTPDAAADASHEAQGFVAGGTYVVQVFDDDGWKTVNGHAGRTPVATYSATLERLSHTFVEMAGSGPTADKFPRLGSTGMTAVQMRDNLMASAPAPMTLSWTAPQPLADGSAFGLWGLWEYFQGPKAGNANGASYPGYRYIAYHYPDSLAVSPSSVGVTATPAELAAKKYTEFTLQYVDRNDGAILSRISFN